MISRVSFALDPDELREVTVYAMYKHVGGTRPVSAMAKEALFAWMRKYPIPEAQRSKLEEKTTRPSKTRRLYSLKGLKREKEKENNEKASEFSIYSDAAHCVRAPD